ncbi:hypothetical protein V1503_18780 [Bacillus sp. SCS-151]|uniref:hypothetical protein n=1 Tax=Nanhaiella sioensis TaxID=3115293 RepID=UPI00397C17FC
MRNRYQSGNTVWLSCEFEEDPQLVKLIIYNYKQEKIEEITSVEKIDVGMYRYPYKTIANKNETLHYEWYGETDGIVNLKRKSFCTSFL